MRFNVKKLNAAEGYRLTISWPFKTPLGFLRIHIAGKTQTKFHQKRSVRRSPAKDIFIRGKGMKNTA